MYFEMKIKLHFIMEKKKKKQPPDLEAQCSTFCCEDVIKKQEQNHKNSVATWSTEYSRRF